MHEIDIWSVPRGHQDNDARKKKKIVQADTKQIDYQLSETMTGAEEEKDWALTQLLFFSLQMTINRL